jgi:hypothetical protein
LLFSRQPRGSLHNEQIKATGEDPDFDEWYDRREFCDIFPSSLCQAPSVCTTSIISDKQWYWSKRGRISNGKSTSPRCSQPASRPRTKDEQRRIEVSEHRARYFCCTDLRTSSIWLVFVFVDFAPHYTTNMTTVQSDAYILRKYRGCLASLVVHLYPNHFKFDQQDGTFSYKSPMRIFIEHLRLGTVPHDLLDMFIASGVTFYEGMYLYAG